MALKAKTKFRLLIEFLRTPKSGIENALLHVRHSGESGNPVIIHTLSNNLFPQILPVRVLFLDQIQLPGPVPLLYLLLACNRRHHVLVQLVIKQIVNAVFFREAVNLIVFVLPSSLF